MFQENQAFQDHQEHQVNQEAMEFPEDQDPMVPWDQMVRQERTGPRELQEHQVLVGNQERRVFVRNTVPSMVESSSKMELVARNTVSSSLISSPFFYFLVINFLSAISKHKFAAIKSIKVC